MKTLIVHAHPEPASFNAAMTALAADTLAGIGHRPVISDLYRMGFDPVSDRRNFLAAADPDFLELQSEEKHAAASNGFAPDLQAEIDKVLACDLLILQFPIWWLSLPAILKGWIDRVFACGVAYGGGRYFASGVFRGKRAMCALTVGGPASTYAQGGPYRAIEPILYPVHRGTLAFTGFTVLEPFVVYGPGQMDAAARQRELARYVGHLRRLDQARILA
jgi:NAD(P)H dehydrogenase (quinone)